MSNLFLNVSVVGVSTTFSHKLFHKFAICKLKNHNTCEEGGAHLKIYFWRLLINLKNNYSLKNC